MQNDHHEPTKLFLGLLIGAVVGAGALYCVRAAQERKTPVLKKIGKTISDVGEMLENCDLSSDHLLESVEKKVPKGSEILDNLTGWIDTGLTLWKKLKKG